MTVKTRLNNYIQLSSDIHYCAQGGVVSILLGISRVSLGLGVDHHGKFAPETPDQTVVSTMPPCLLQ
jgi:hypothetical protein